MTVVWDDVNARVRGLSNHLLGPVRLRRLAETSTLTTLAEQLDRLGYWPAGVDRPVPGVSAAGIDRALRRGAAARLRTLQRWCAGRVACLAVLFEDEDRRSLRALLRGSAAGVALEARLASLIPTPSLPAKALEELARQATPATLATLLVVWGNPYGSVLLPEAERDHPDLLLLELALNRRFAERALAASRRGGRTLLVYAREVIDLENAASALVLAGGRSEVAPADCFLPGGRRLTLPMFVGAAGAKDRSEAAGVLGRAFEKKPFGEVFLRSSGEPGAIEPEILRAQIHEQERAARRAPLGPAVIVAYALRLRAEAMDLRRIAWGLALGLPPAIRAEGLVSAA